MITIGPVERIEMTYEDAVLYCNFCDHDGHNDWRMPTWDEEIEYGIICSWHLNDASTNTWWVTPVRDIK